MPRLFAVTRSRGPAWNQSLLLEQKDDWPAHAAFMNALHAEGFVLCGGPLEGTSDVLLIVRANDANEIHARLSIDCWTSKDLLPIKQIAAWTIRLRSLGRLDKREVFQRPRTGHGGLEPTVGLARAESG